MLHQCHRGNWIINNIHSLLNDQLILFIIIRGEHIHVDYVAGWWGTRTPGRKDWTWRHNRRSQIHPNVWRIWHWSFRKERRRWYLRTRRDVVASSLLSDCCFDIWGLEWGGFWSLGSAWSRPLGKEGRKVFLLQWICRLFGFGGHFERQPSTSERIPSLRRVGIYLCSGTSRSWSVAWFTAVHRVFGWTKVTCNDNSDEIFQLLYLKCNKSSWFVVWSFGLSCWPRFRTEVLKIRQHLATLRICCLLRARTTNVCRRGESFGDWSASSPTKQSTPLILFDWSERLGNRRTCTLVQTIFRNLPIPLALITRVFWITFDLYLRLIRIGRPSTSNRSWTGAIPNRCDGEWPSYLGKYDTYDPAWYTCTFVYFRFHFCGSRFGGRCSMLVLY